MTPDTSKKCNFTDVSIALDTQYNDGVTKICELGLMGVGITKFNPDELISRADFATAFDRAFNKGIIKD